jgi:hypothetical protein
MVLEIQMSVLAATQIGRLKDTVERSPGYPP